MLVKTLWFWRKTEDSPELLLAWDELSVEENRDGWRQACQKELDAVRSDMSSSGYRYIDLRLDADKIAETFFPNEIEAEVKP